jgi:hypothetical protein
VSSVMLIFRQTSRQVLVSCGVKREATRPNPS